MIKKRKLKIIICKGCGKVFTTYRNSQYCSRSCAGNTTKSKKDTICWECKRSTGFCSWSEKFIPVEGWEATPTIIKIANNTGKNKATDESFIVHKCPLFERG
jgi:hypothetical protein